MLEWVRAESSRRRLSLRFMNKLRRSSSIRGKESSVARDDNLTLANAYLAERWMITDIRRQ